ncbi:MAG: tripartite tricarboxylate transporter substrate binding protein [Spirochaetales bacterium]|nr:tripartite tricarboxylate transporter substrate binding protein [Spirochaetales bacterium]
MKKLILAMLMASVLVSPIFANGENEKQNVEGPFVPQQSIEWYCTSSPGGGSDIFTRTIIDIINEENLANGQNIVIQYKTDGAGEIGRNLVSNTKGEKADYTLLTFNSGDLMPMVKNTNKRFEDFQPISHMAVDKHLLFVGENPKYNSFEEVIEGIKAGDQIVLGGSKGDDIACYNALIEELGFDNTQLSFISHDGSGAAITAMLGGHVDLLISKPAAASQYVEAGRIKPVLALSTSRFPGNLNSAPTLSELGYNDVESPNWRSVVAPAAMSEKAAQFWSDVLKKVSESDKWKNDYINVKKLVPDYMDKNEFKEYGEKFQMNYLKSIGK